MSQPFDPAAEYEKIRADIQGAVDKLLQHFAQQLGITQEPSTPAPAPAAHPAELDGLQYSHNIGSIAQ